MNDLLSKLNTLARAKLSDALPQLPRFERAPDLQRQVTDLRKRINDALDHEDQLQAQVNALRDEAAQLDIDADHALSQGRDDEARRILEQLKRTEQRLSIAESDLKLHQRDAAELILKVNQLEAAVADHQAAVSGMADPASPPAETTTYTPPASTSTEPARSTSRLERPPQPAQQPSSSTPAASTPAAPTPPAPPQPSAPPTPPIPVEAVEPVETAPTETTAAPSSTTPTSAPTGLDTSFAANDDALPEITSGGTDNPTQNTAPSTSEAAPVETKPDTKSVKPEDDTDDQRETAKSYAKRAREAAIEQADKTTSSVDQISDIIRDAQEKTRARIQSLTDILDAKDREQAANPLFNRENRETPAGAAGTNSPAPATTSTVPTETPPATAAETAPPTDTPASPTPATNPPATPPTGGDAPASGDAPKSEDALSERLKRLSKPDA